MLQNTIPLWKSKSIPPNNVNKHISNMTPATDIFFCKNPLDIPYFLLFIFFFLHSHITNF